jgi:hypothetical protein
MIRSYQGIVEMKNLEDWTFEAAQKRLVIIENELGASKIRASELKTTLKTIQPTDVKSVIEKERILASIDADQDKAESLSEERSKLQFLMKAEEAKLKDSGYQQAYAMAQHPQIHEVIGEYWQAFNKPISKRVVEKKKTWIFDSYESRIIAERLPFKIDISEGKKPYSSMWEQNILKPNTWIFNLFTFIEEHRDEHGARIPIYFVVNVIWRRQKTKSEYKHGGVITGGYRSGEDRKQGLAIEIPSMTKSTGENVFYSVDEFCSFVARAIVRDQPLH